MNASPLSELLPILERTPGIAAIVLGGSRARGTARESSDYDIGLYFHRDHTIDVDALRKGVETIADIPPIVTGVGEWGPWVVGGGWLRIAGLKVDLLYRPLESVSKVIDACRAGEVTVAYQPGHPHGFCSAIWAGEVALCRTLSDSGGELAALKSKTTPFPELLRDALLRRFFWEVLFSIENAEIGAARNDQSYVCGCAYRALACIAQTLFALNRRYLINEKAALAETGGFPITVNHLDARAKSLWRALGDGQFDRGLRTLRTLESELRSLVSD